MIPHGGILQRTSFVFTGVFRRASVFEDVSAFGSPELLVMVLFEFDDLRGMLVGGYFLIFKN